MAVARPWQTALPLLIALWLAALWPLSAYAVSPLVMPALVLIVAVLALVTWRPEYGLALVAALAPWTNMRALETGGNEAIALPGKPLHLALPALAFGLLAFSVLVTRAHGQTRGRWLSGAVVVFVAVAVASAQQALEPSDSVSKVFILLTAAALFFAVLQVCQERRQLLVVVGGVVLGLVLASAQGVVQHYSGNLGPYGVVAGGSVLGRVQGAFGHPNQYGGFIAVLLPLAVAVLVTGDFSRRLRWLAAIGLVLSFMALSFSYTRGAIAAVVLGSIVWLAFVRPRAAAVAAVAVVIAALTIVPSALRERFDPQGASGDVPLRADIWSSALDIYSEHPLLGVGVNNFQNAYAGLSVTQSSASQRRLLHQRDLVTPPHAQNLYLNVLAEEGLLGLVSLALLGLAAAATAYRGSRLRDPAGRAVSIALGAGVMSLAVHSLLEVTLFGEAALPLFALLGVAAAWVSLEERRTRTVAVAA